MELRSCYFCGSIGASLDARSVAPDGSAPAADPVRVVLCTDCHAKLDRILDRALDARGEDARGGAESTPGGPSVDGSASAELAAEESTAAESTDGESGEQDSDDPTDASRSDGAFAGADGITFGGADDGPPAGDAADRDADVAGDADDGDEEGDDGTDAADDTPSGQLRGLGDGETNPYRKALRLLRNREFPMARTDLVEVMASAYELDPDECERLIDFAVDRGLLVDDGGELRRA